MVSIKFNKRPKSFFEFSDPNAVSFSYGKIEMTNSLTGDMYICSFIG